VEEIKEALNLIFEEKEITNPERLKAIKKRISEWSNSIPHHNLTDLGEKIEFLSVKEIPSYEIILLTLYQKRELKKGMRIYQNEPIPPKLIDEKM